MKNNDRLSQVCTCIPTELKREAEKYGISFAKATTLGINILIKNEEELMNTYGGLSKV